MRTGAERPERDDCDDGPEHRSRVVTGARGHPDRRRDPQRRRRRQPADGEALADDRSGTDEADAGDDLRGDARRIGADDLVAAVQELAEAVRGDDREERRAETDEHVRSQSGFPVAQLALEPDRTAERGGDREAQQVVVPAERRDGARTLPK